MTEKLVAASAQHPRFGYRRMAAWLDIGQAKVRRLWRAWLEHSPSPAALASQWQRYPFAGAVRPNAVRSYDFVHDQLVVGLALKLLCVIDEYIRECPEIEVDASLRSQDVILILSRLMRLYGKPAFVRSDNGAEFIATKVMR